MEKYLTSGESGVAGLKTSLR
jgi:hypothetical protein